MDPDLHKEYTGTDNKLIQENLKKLSKVHKRIWIRIPVIGGVNDTMENMEETADFLKDNDIRPEHIHLLPYHETGSGKYERLKRTYDEAFTVPKDEELNTFRAVFEERGFSNVLIGG